jgi:hypothetical protein
VANYGAPVTISVHQSPKFTGIVQVSWVKNGVRKSVWEENRFKTAASFPEILKLLKAKA